MEYSIREVTERVGMDFSVAFIKTLRGRVHFLKIFGECHFIRL